MFAILKGNQETMMENIRKPDSLHADENPTNYLSFILRCWQDSVGVLRARIIDVRTGCQYSLNSVADLPELVEDIFSKEQTSTDDELG